MIQKGLKIEILVQKYPFLAEFFLSGIEGYPLTPLNRIFCNFSLAEKGVTPPSPLDGKNLLIVSARLFFAE